VTYALLIYRTLSLSEAALSEALPGAERDALLGHRTLQAEASARGELHAVVRLDETSTARTVRPRASAREVTDGPIIETKEWLVGLYVIDCESEEQAIARARLLCPDDSHGVEVRPARLASKGASVHASLASHAAAA
jgi:hypothetical protein